MSRNFSKKKKKKKKNKAKNAKRRNYYFSCDNAQKRRVGVVNIWGEMQKNSLDKGLIEWYNKLIFSVDRL